MSLHQSRTASSSDEWQTPERVLELVRTVNRIALDPCTTKSNPVGADECYYLPKHDGLLLRWSVGAGLNYVNPPYGRAIAGWVECCVENSLWDCEIIALVPANTDTRWYDRANTTANARCEVRGRLTFKGAPAPAKFGSAVFYWGAQPYLFCHVFAALGRVAFLRDHMEPPALQEAAE